jgi:hypothetical protein
MRRAAHSAARGPQKPRWISSSRCCCAVLSDGSDGQRGGRNQHWLSPRARMGSTFAATQQLVRDGTRVEPGPWRPHAGHSASTIAPRGIARRDREQRRPRCRVRSFIEPEGPSRFG